MSYKIKFIIYLMSTCFISTVTFAQTPIAIDRFVESYNVQQFAAAVSNFHIADGFSKSERDEEIEGLVASFKILFSEFGQIRNLKKSSQQAESADNLTDINIFSMSEAYWAERQGFQIEQFVCKFQNAGVGQLDFMLYDEAGKTLLRSVNFALPKSATASQAVISQVGKKLHTFYEDRSLRRDALSGQVRLSILITSTKKAAEAAKEMLQSGMTFADAVKKYSIEQSSNQAGDTGYVFPDDILPTLQPAAINLVVGEISDVLQLNERFVLVQKTDQK
ncbi:MAG: peptidylprolyl isomerase [Calditrichia bacterium]